MEEHGEKEKRRCGGGRLLEHCRSSLGCRMPLGLLNLHKACKAERWWMVEAVQHAQMPTSHWTVADRVEQMDTHPPAGSGRFQLHLLTRRSGEICSRWALRVLDRLEKVSRRPFGALLIGSRGPAGPGGGGLARCRIPCRPQSDSYRRARVLAFSPPTKQSWTKPSTTL